MGQMYYQLTYLLKVKIFKNEKHPAANIYEIENNLKTDEERKEFDVWTKELNVDTLKRISDVRTPIAHPTVMDSIISNLYDDEDTTITPAIIKKVAKHLYHSNVKELEEIDKIIETTYRLSVNLGNQFMYTGCY